MSIIEKLKYLREYNGLSVQDAAALFKVHGETILRWERGGSYPNPKNLKTIADYYGVSAEWLLTGITDGTNILETMLSDDVTSNESRFFSLFVTLPEDAQDKFIRYFNKLFNYSDT